MIKHAPHTLYSLTIFGHTSLVAAVKSSQYSCDCTSFKIIEQSLKTLQCIRIIQMWKLLFIKSTNS